MKEKMARREFLRRSAAVTAAAPVMGRLSASSRAVVPPSDRIRFGFIGMGRQGIYNMEKFLEYPEVEAVALCDVYDPHLEEAHEISSARKYKDFRAVLERNDIDAVVISSPDHWHALMTVTACQAGKDVYVEKPISVAVAEGRKMVQAARRFERVVQVGTQQRSGLHFQRAVDLIQKGELGEITSVRSWNYGNDSPQGIGNPADTSPPAGLDWDLWLGPAPKVPFNANRFGVHPERWSTFRWFWDYAGGMMTDWGVHLLDIVQWAMQVDAPKAVSAGGGKYVLEDNRETPDTLIALFEYPSFVCTYENRSCNGRQINDHGYGIEFYGTRGTLFIDRGGFEIQPESTRVDDREVARMYRMEHDNVNNHNHDHVGNFLECIKTRQLPISDIEIGHRSSSACYLGNIAYRTGRKIRWDSEQEKITGDSEASRMLDRPYRAPWKLEV